MIKPFFSEFGIRTKEDYAESTGLLGNTRYSTDFQINFYNCY